MLPQRLRTWIWRANAVLAVLLVVVWAHAVTGPADAPTFKVPEPRQHEDEVGLEASVSFTDLVAHARPFHGWGERAVVEKPAPIEPPPGELPLAALACRGWIRCKDGPDSVILKSKDPARPALYLPVEGRPDRGIAILRIEPVGELAKVTVRRGGETFTYTLRRARGAGDARVRIRRGAAASLAAERGGASAPQTAEGRASIKLLPYYDADEGHLCGARVTGVRPGSRLEKLGLRAGDVVVGLDQSGVASVEQVRGRLLDDATKVDIEILRGLEGEQKRLRLGG